MQISAYFTLALAFCLVVSFASDRANAVQLRQSVAVSENVVTLGDIFMDLESAADSAVMRAPKPGKSMVLSTAKLLQLAKAKGIAWVPQFGDETLFIERLSDVVGRQEIFAALQETLVMDGFGENYEFELSSHITPIHVAIGKSASVDIISLDIDSRHTRFSATVAAPANDPAAQRVRVTGRIHQTELLPVVIRRIDSGETIGEADVAWRRLRVSNIRSGTVAGMGELIGMNARRPLRPEMAVRRADLTTPILISKGASVRMVYRSGGLLLVALGRAIEDGAAGQDMRIMNLKSKKVVIAKATGPDTVTVSQNGLIGFN
jgi:flagella basal body P-ring formation protein FlgA